MNPEDIYNSPIKTNDAASMLRKRVHANEKPLVSEIAKLNNRSVDCWKKSILDKISDSECNVPAGRVWHSWELYNEGKCILEYMKLKEEGYIPDPPKETIDFWMRFFQDLSVETIHSYGSGNVSYGWSLITTAMKQDIAEKKYEKLYGKYKTPLEWEKNCNAHKDLLSGKNLLFWDEDTMKTIREKVTAVLMNQVSPNAEKIKSPLTAKEAVGMLTRKSTKIDRPYVKQTTDMNTIQIQEWGKTLSDNEMTFQRALKLWEIYYEGMCILKRDGMVKDGFIIKNDPVVVAKWVNLFENSSVGHLHSLGSGAIFYGWKIIQTEIRSVICQKKFEIYNSKKPEEWYSLIDELKETESQLPFWDDETLEKITSIVATILSVTVKPQKSPGFQ